MFEIEKQETINKTFRFPEKLLKEMKEIAKSKGVSLNNLVVQCCKYAIEHLK